MNAHPDSGAIVLLAFIPMLFLAMYLRRRLARHGTMPRGIAIAASCSAALLAVGLVAL